MRIVVVEVDDKTIIEVYQDPETIEAQMEADAEAENEADETVEAEGEEAAEQEAIAPEDDLAPEELPEPTTEVDPQHLQLLEALIFASVDPVPQHICKQRLPEDANIPALLSRLRADYASRGVNLMKIGKGWAFRTAAALAPELATNREVTRKMSRAAVETLAVIAYHQPVTRAETGPGVKAIQPALVPWMYAGASGKIAYPMLVLLAVGAVRHRKRVLRFGSDPDWSPL